MKRKTVFMILVCAALASAPLQAAKEMTFSVVENTAHTVIGVRVLREAYRRIGIDITIIEYPAKRSIVEANQGRTDGEVLRISGASAEYPNLIQVPIPISFLEGMVFSKRIDFPVKGWASLKPYKVGIRRGIKFAENGLKGMEPMVVNSNKQLFLLLDIDRVDVIVLARLTGLATLKQSDEFKNSVIKPLEPPIISHPFYHYLHIDHEQLVPKILAVFREMEKEGWIERARQQYIEEFFK